MDFTVLGNGWPDSKWIVSISMGLLTDGQYSTDLRLELTLCAIHARVQTQRVRRRKELCVQNAQWALAWNIISTATAKIITELNGHLVES